MTNYLAIDIGASSGRHIIGRITGEKLELEEVYRFENRMIPFEGHLIWDVEALFREVLEGMKRCRERGLVPETVAIDTWGVDYVLLDGNGKEILPAYAYRDGRTSEKEMAGFPLSREDLYRTAGIQEQPFNTIYQFWAEQKEGRLDRAEQFLMMPAYLSYRLTGKAGNEYTNATTTGLIRAGDRNWDRSVIEALGYPSSLFRDLYQPGEYLGEFTQEVRQAVGFNASVIFTASHDTASAVAACPIDEKTVYISSGTWSLIGTENPEPVLSDEARLANFSNEGSLEGKFRFLKNIMGTWVFQSLRREFGGKITYDEMMGMAEKSAFRDRFDMTDPRFLAPGSMLEEIRGALNCPELPPSDILKSVYLSLAYSYRDAISEIERICGKAIDSIFIVGGGSKDRYLNRLTSEITGKRVLTGLQEATAVGNLAGQIICRQKTGLGKVRELIRRSFDIRETN